MLVAKGAVLLLLTASAAADISVGEKVPLPRQDHCFKYDAKTGDVDYSSTNCNDGEYCDQGKCEKCPVGTVMPKGTTNPQQSRKGLDKSHCLKVPKGHKATSSDSGSAADMQASTEDVIYTLLHPYAVEGITACTGDQYQDEVGQLECKTCSDGKTGAKEYSDTTLYDKMCGSTATMNNNPRGTWDSSSADSSAVCEAKAEIGWNLGNTRCVSCDTDVADGGPGKTGDVFTKVLGGVRSQCQQPGSTCGQGYVQEGSVCFQCPKGKYTAEADCTTDAGCSKCTDCPAGKTTTAEGKHLATADDPTETNTVCTYSGCENGYYCPGGSAKIRCPVGTYTGFAPYKEESTLTIEKGFAECSTCASGTTTVGALSCRAASVDGATCALGYIKDGETCKACTNGTFSNKLDATECTPCPKGYISGNFEDRWDYGKDWEYAGGLKGASTCSKCPGNKVVNGSNCSYCEPGTTMFQGALAATWDQRDYPDSLKNAMGPSCWKCGPGTFSNASTVIDYGCPDGSKTKASGNWITSITLDGNEESVPNGDLHTRAECQAIHFNYAMGGACFPCPAGQVSAQPFGSTECMACPDGTFPSADRGSCVSRNIVPYIILVLILLIACLCLAPCLTAKFGKLGFIPIKGYRLKIAHLFLLLAMLVALFGGEIMGVEKSQLMTFLIVGLFLVACVPAWCAALYPMEEGLPKVQQQIP